VYARNGSWLDRPLHRQRQQLRLWSGITEERRKFEESIGAKAPPSRYRLAKDKLADLMAAGNRAGTDQAHKHDVLVLKTPLTGTVEVFDGFVPTGTGAAKVQWYYRM
jgi:hypothetical protein